MKKYLYPVGLIALLPVLLAVGCGLMSPTSPAPAPSLTPLAPQATTTPLRIPPNIPFDHAGRTECFLCHLTGAEGAPPVPHEFPDHRQFADDRAVCARCHPVVGQNAPPYP